MAEKQKLDTEIYVKLLMRQQGAKYACVGRMELRGEHCTARGVIVVVALTKRARVCDETACGNPSGVAVLHYTLVCLHLQHGKKVFPSDTLQVYLLYFLSYTFQ